MSTLHEGPNILTWTPTAQKDVFYMIKEEAKDLIFANDHEWGIDFVNPAADNDSSENEKELCLTISKLNELIEMAEGLRNFGIRSWSKWNERKSICKRNWKGMHFLP